MDSFWPLLVGSFDCTTGLATRALSPLFGANGDVRITVVKILGVNASLVVTQALIYQKVVVPGTEWWTGTGTGPKDNHTVAVLGSYLIVLVGFYIFCYTRVLKWYQSLADAMLLRQRRKLPSKPTDNPTFATLIWLFLFLQQQFLVNGMPPLLVATENAFPRLRGLIAILERGSYFAGHGLIAFLYSWYGFEPFQISRGMKIDERIDSLESHWLYYVGFGLPFVVASKYLSYFKNLSIFLACFPFLVILGALLEPQNAFQRKKTQSAPIFSLARAQTEFVIRILGLVGLHKREKTE